MTEILVGAYRAADEDRASRFRSLFANYPHLEWFSPDLEISDLAARIRARHNLRIADALQAATAIRVHATAFIGNDPVFRRIPEFATIVLDDYL